MNFKAALVGIAFGLAAVWLVNNSPTVARLTGPGKNGQPLLPF